MTTTDQFGPAIPNENVGTQTLDPQSPRNQSSILIGVPIAVLIGAVLGIVLFFLLKKWKQKRGRT